MLAINYLQVPVYKKSKYFIKNLTIFLKSLCRALPLTEINLVQKWPQISSPLLMLISFLLHNNIKTTLQS